MNSNSAPAAGTRQATTVTCGDCAKETTVPFVPTPGRPVYCRDCFAKRQNAPQRGGGSTPRPGGPQRPGPRGRGGGFGRAEVNTRPQARRRMMKQGRKTHFLYDARELMEKADTGMEANNHRAFLEGLFARGARNGTESAIEFLDEKEGEGVITKDEHKGLLRLVDRYSQWR